jgi:hypothetical protein
MKNTKTESETKVFKKTDNIKHEKKVYIDKKELKKLLKKEFDSFIDYNTIKNIETLNSDSKNKKISMELNITLKLEDIEDSISLKPDLSQFSLSKPKI